MAEGMDETILMDVIAADLEALYNDSNNGEGVSPHDFARREASIYVSRILNHIKTFAIVKLDPGQSMEVPGAGTELTNGAGAVSGSIATPPVGSEWQGKVL